jgi:hypothetical protein
MNRLTEKSTNPTRSRAAVLAGAAGAAVLMAVGCAGHPGHDGDRGAAPAWLGTDAAPPSGAHLIVTTDQGLRLRPADGRTASIRTGPATPDATDDGTASADGTGDGRVTAHWSHGDGVWTLDLSCPAHAAHGCPRTPVLRVPAGLAITVRARNAGVDVAGVSATGLDLSTVNGDVTLTRAGGAHATVRLTTRNGSVRADGLRARRLGARTVNGDVQLSCANGPADADAATTNGSVSVEVPHGTPAYRVSARTSNGHPTVTVPTAHPAPGRHLDLTTVNGDVTATLLA